MEETLIKRVLPHSIEAEQSVIGSMLMDREAVIAASEIITGSDFYQQQYGIMFDAMVELFNEGRPSAPSASHPHISDRATESGCSKSRSFLCRSRLRCSRCFTT